MSAPKVRAALLAPLAVCFCVLALVLGLLYASSGVQAASPKAHRPKVTRTVTATATITQTVTATATATVTVPGPTTTVTVTGEPSSTSTNTLTATPTVTATSTPPAGGNVCTDENAYTNWAGERYDWIDDTTSPTWNYNWGAGGMGDYYATADMWGANGYDVWQHSVFCDRSSWYVEADADNSRNDGAIKSYPNTHYDFHNWSTDTEPPLSNYPVLTSSFAHQSPDTCTGCIYDWAYDVWLSDYKYEVMIWTDAKVQHPSLVTSKFATVDIDGRSWDYYRWLPGGTGNGSLGILFFYPSDGQPITGGDFNIKAFLTYLQGVGHMSSTATLSAVAYGVEIVSTGNTLKRFDVTAFDVSTN